MSGSIQAPAAVGGASQPNSMFSRLSRASASPDWLAPFAPGKDARSVAAVTAPSPVDMSAGLASVDFPAAIGTSSPAPAATSRKGFLSMFSRGAAAAAPQPPMALDSLVTIDDMPDAAGNPSVNVTVNSLSRAPAAAGASSSRRVDNKALAVDGTWGALSGLNNTPVAAPAFKLFSQPKAPRAIDAPVPATVEPPKALWSELPGPTLDAFSRHNVRVASDDTREFSYDHRLHPPHAVTVSPLRAATPSPAQSPLEAAPLVPVVAPVHALQPIGEDSPMMQSLTELPASPKPASKLPATVASASVVAPNTLSQLWSQDWWASLLNAAGSPTSASPAPTVAEFSRSVAPPATLEDHKQRERDAKKEDYLQTIFAPEEPLLALASIPTRPSNKPMTATSAILAEFDEEDRRADDLYQAVSIVLEAVRHSETPNSPSPLF